MAFNTSVTLVGNLTRDPKIVGEGDSKRALLGIAVNEPRRDAEDKTSFHNVTAFGPALAENIAASLKKGARVVVRGSLETYPKEVTVNGEDVTLQMTTVRADDVAADLRWAQAEITRTGGRAAAAEEEEAAAAPARKSGARPAAKAPKAAPKAAAQDDDDLF